MKTEFDIPFILKTLGKTIGGYVYKKGVMIFEVPGFAKEDLKIKLDGYTMEITGKKEILGEIYEINKSFVLPEGSLNGDDPITAKVENGILFINLKKSERSKQTNVDIS